MDPYTLQGIWVDLDKFGTLERVREYMKSGSLIQSCVATSILTAMNWP